MPRSTSVLTPASFSNFGDLLHHLRRRARLTQTELGIAVGYSNGQISRLEQNRRLPDQATLTALFVPALQLGDEPDWVARLLELAAEARHQGPEDETAQPKSVDEAVAVETIPRPAPYEVERPKMQMRLMVRLTTERQVALCALGGMGKTTLAAAVARARAGTSPVFWITLTNGVNTAVDAIVQQLASFLAAQGQKQVLPLLRAADNALPFNQQIALLGAGLNSLAIADPSDLALPLLCFDNVHLVQNDSNVIQMLRHLMASTPALFLLTSREEVPLPELAQIQLIGLEETEGAHLIERLAGSQAASPLDPALTAHLLNKTGGSPMLLRLALGHLLDQPTDLANFVAQLETQPQVASYLLDTVQRQLSPDAWRLLTQLSVFNRGANLNDPLLVELIQAEEGPYAIGAAIAELQHRQLIDHPALARLHPLIRDYVYATLAADPARRKRLHLVAAEWAERSQGDVLRAARHQTLAGQADEVAELLQGAEPALIRQGQALTAVSVVDNAISQLRQQRPPAPEIMRKLLAVRGQLLIGSLRQNEAQADFEEALRLTDNPSVRAELVYRLGLMLSLKGQFSEALELTQATAAALAPTDTVLLAQLAAIQGQALYRIARYEEAREAVQRALSLSQQFIHLHIPIADEVQARAYYVLGDLHRVRSEYAQALDCWEKCAAAARQARHLRLESAALVCIGGVRYDEGNLTEAWRIRTEALAVAQHMGHAYLEAYALAHLADVHHDRCEFEAELGKLNRAHELLLQIGDQVGAANIDNQRANSYLVRGCLTEAHDIMGPLLSIKSEGAVPRLQAQYVGTVARLQALAGQLEPAETDLRTALVLPTIADMPVIHDWLTHYLVIVLLAQGKHAAARAALADMSGQQSNVWMELQRQLAAAAVALAEEDIATASKLCDEVNERARAYGHELFRRQAERLKQVTLNPLPLATLPHRLWVFAD